MTARHNRNADAVLAYLAEHPNSTAYEIQTAWHEMGRKLGNVSPTLTELGRLGKIEKVGGHGGRYRLVAPPEPAPAPTPAPIVLPQYLRHLATWCELNAIPVRALHFWHDGPSIQIDDADFERLMRMPGAVVEVRPFRASAVHESVTVDDVTAWRHRPTHVVAS